jgi:hypothetical protein
MTQLLAIAAQSNAPIGCDMTATADTREARLAEYARLFAYALQGRQRTPNSTVFVSDAKSGVRDWIVDLAEREAGCCPFLSYSVRGNDEHIEWATIYCGPDSPAVQAMLDEFHKAPEWAGDGPGVIAGRLEDLGFVFAGEAGRPGYPFAGAELGPLT